MERDNKITVISIILALLCIALLGYIIYFKINSKKEEIIPDPASEETPSEEVEPKKEEEKKDDYEEVVKKLYAVIGTNSEFRPEEIVEYKDLSESIRDNIVINSLSDKCQELFSYEKELFLNKYEEIFNKAKSSDEGLCKLNGDKYECSSYCDEFKVKVFNVYEKYELADDSIVIYEKAGHLDYADDGKVYLKKNDMDTTSIASFESLDELKESNTEYDLPKYKHTFIKSEDNYYWVSSESVKQ